MDQIQRPPDPLLCMGRPLSPRHSLVQSAADRPKEPAARLPGCGHGKDISCGPCRAGWVSAGLGKGLPVKATPSNGMASCGPTLGSVGNSHGPARAGQEDALCQVQRSHAAKLPWGPHKCRVQSVS